MSRESMVLVFFVYGFSFFFLGVAILLEFRRESRFEFNKSLPLLGLFGLAHGTLEWNDMFGMLANLGVVAIPAHPGQVLSAVLLPVSYLFLMAFGCGAFASLHPNSSSTCKKGFVGYLAASTLAIALLTPSGKPLGDWLIAAKPFVRYFWGGAGCLSTAVSLYLARNTPYITAIGGRIPRSFVGLGAAFLSYLVFSGVVVEPNSTWIGQLVNAGTFQHAFGLPVQLFRAGCAAASAYLITVVLKVFELEIQGTLRKERDSLGVAKRQIQNVLDNLGQGFLTFDREGSILDGYSQSVRSLFDMDPNGLKFSALLRKNPEDAAKVSEWISMLFDEALPFEDLVALGPGVHQTSSKFLKIEYRAIRAKESGKIEKVIVIATDKTVEKELEERHRQEESFSRMLLAIAKDRDGFRDFLMETRKLFEDLNSSIPNLNNREEIARMFRIAHSIKGNASAYCLQNVKEQAHLLEERLSQLQSPSAGGQVADSARSELVKLTADFNRCFSLALEDVKRAFGDEMVEQGAERRISGAALATLVSALEKRLGNNSSEMLLFNDVFYHEDFCGYWRRFAPKILDMATSMGKEVKFEVRAEGQVRVNVEPYKGLLQSAIHAFRNSLDHGLETAEERVAAGKPAQGTSSVNLRKIERNGNRWIEITIQDDGRGIDPDRVKSAALKKGVITPAQAETLSQSDILELLTKSGFSMSDQVSEWSGRGVGLDAVATECRKLGGRVKIESAPGAGTQLILEVPHFTMSGPAASKAA